MYRYNYILFNSYDNKLKIDRNGYYTICAQELETSPSIRVVSYPLDIYPYWIRLLFAIHHSEKIARYIKLPFKKLWYPYYFKNDFEEKKPFCFVILNRFLPIEYLSYLKKMYPDCRIVLLHRDLLRICKRLNPELSQNPILDLEMTYDKGEAQLYGMPYFNEFESSIDILKEKKMESDVFFAGKAKDRLPQLMEAYKVFTKNGLKCNFYLVGVPINEQKELPGVKYASCFMSYKEMLYHTVNTRCVLEVNQGGSNGYTSRFLESVIYGKKLITNNLAIKESKYYFPDKIMIVNKMSDIDPLFVTKGGDFVNYNYEDDFSPFKVISRIEEELSKKYGKY